MLAWRHPRSSPRRADSVRVAILAIVSALALGVASGMTWLLVALATRQAGLWLALPSGLILGMIVRWGVHATPRWRGLCSGLAMLVATLWVATTFVALQIGANMGLGVREAASTAGIGLLWQLLQLGTSRADLVWCVLGIGVATLVAHGGTTERLSGRVSRPGP